MEKIREDSELHEKHRNNLQDSLKKSTNRVRELEKNVIQLNNEKQTEKHNCEAVYKMVSTSVDYRVKDSFFFN